LYRKLENFAAHAAPRRRRQIYWTGGAPLTKIDRTPPPT